MPAAQMAWLAAEKEASPLGDAGSWGQDVPRGGRDLRGRSYVKVEN